MTTPGEEALARQLAELRASPAMREAEADEAARAWAAGRDPHCPVHGLAKRTTDKYGRERWACCAWAEDRAMTAADRERAERDRLAVLESRRRDAAMFAEMDAARAEREARERARADLFGGGPA